MSREDLRAMLTDLADDVPPPQLVGPVLTRAASVRRRRRTIGAAALVVVVAAGVGVSVTLRGPGPAETSLVAPGATVATAPSGTLSISRLPETLARDAQASPYWPTKLNPPATTPRLADAPFSRAVLLYSPYPVNADSPPGPIYAYGDGSINGGSGSGEFHWARLDVSLTHTRDAGGNRAVPLDQGSLGPMGKRAAFAQPDAVVIVDLITNTTDRIPVDGLNEDVSWLPDGRHVLVSSATRTWLVNTDARTVVPVTVRGSAVAPLVGDGTGLTALDLADGGTGALVLHRYDAGGMAEQSQHEITRPTPLRVTSLYGHGWRYGNLVAQSTAGQLGSEPGEFLVIIDDRTNAVSHALDLSGEPNKGCCTVLGWRNSTEVIVATPREGLLVWRLANDTITRLIEPGVPGALSVAPSGCNWEITIGTQSAACKT